MSSRICCVRGCSSIESNIPKKLFKFPLNTNPRAQSWLELYPHSFLREPNVDNYICSRHFTADCFNKSGGLLHRATPSVNIDTSYAQDIIMRSFLMKVMFEWVLRNEIEAFSLVIWDKALEAKKFLGMQTYAKKSVFTSKFVKFKIATEKNKLRFGSGQKGPKQIREIIKDIREEIPSNFLLPVDNILGCDSGEVPVKEEDEEADYGVNSTLFENEESADEHFYQNQRKEERKDIVPNKSLDTYQEALELLKPLKDYIERSGNENASLRLSEIETVVKQAIKCNAGVKRASKRRR